ncbi:hypothetical protein B0B51_18030 (plasmid) [blood disease bacterium A2-HR MARDI]|uniref:Uncharacterized protein n=1 Tax=blood disease bacterium A2-HR MARDI TaxID=1944648 RepID=A0A1U9VNQ8_9RALS|nr:hypothetical protein B0B51_18030 [blood disease bacterium A2-HR MARDI]
MNRPAHVLVAIDVANGKAARHFNVQPPGVWLCRRRQKLVDGLQGQPGQFRQALTIYAVQQVQKKVAIGTLTRNIPCCAEVVQGRAPLLFLFANSHYP